jgi:hypothetical protein
VGAPAAAYDLAWRGSRRPWQGILELVLGWRLRHPARHDEVNDFPDDGMILNRGLAASFVLSSSTRRLFCSACAALAVSAFAASLASRTLSSSRRFFCLVRILCFRWLGQLRLEELRQLRGVVCYV